MWDKNNKYKYMYMCIYIYIHKHMYMYIHTQHWLRKYQVKLYFKHVIHCFIL